MVASQLAVTSLSQVTKYSPALPGPIAAKIIVPKAPKVFPKASPSPRTISVESLNILLSSPVASANSIVF